jgi:hypothetical protein
LARKGFVTGVFIRNQIAQARSKAPAVRFVAFYGILLAIAFYEGFTAGLLGTAFTAQRPSSADEIIDALMVGWAPRKKIGSRTS